MANGSFWVYETDIEYKKIFDKDIKLNTTNI